MSFEGWRKKWFPQEQDSAAENALALLRAHRTNMKQQLDTLRTHMKAIGGTVEDGRAETLLLDHIAETDGKIAEAEQQLHGVVSE